MVRVTKYSNDIIRNKAINIIRKLDKKNGLNGDQLSLISAFCLIERVENKTLKEYEDLEEQGKLLRLPCTVGDKVYVLAECENIPTQLDGTLYGANGEPGTATGYYCPYENNCPFDDEDFENCEKCKRKTAVFEDTVLFIACYENEMFVVTEKCAVHSTIGLHVFLTRQEAERALAEMEGKK